MAALGLEGGAGWAQGTVQAAPSEEAAVVSVRQLQHRISNAARKELIRSVQVLEQGDVRQAMVHAERAIKLDPAYAEAYNDLAVCYSRLDQFDKAVEELERARALDPSLPAVYTNLSAALMVAKHYEEAGEAAGHALKLDPGNEKAGFLLGLSLTAQGKQDGEALRYLERATEKFPEARVALADIHARHGRRAQAIEQLRRYLATADATARREAVEAWLARLQQ